MSDIDKAGRPTAMKPFSFTAHTAQEQRPRGRAGSNTSTSSATTTASTKSHDQFVFSPHQTPASEKDPFFSHQEFSSLHHPQTHSECRIIMFLPNLIRAAMTQMSCSWPNIGPQDVVLARCLAVIAATAITSAVTMMASEW